MVLGADSLLEMCICQPLRAGNNIDPAPMFSPVGLAGLATFLLPHARMRSERRVAAIKWGSGSSMIGSRPAAKVLQAFAGVPVWKKCCAVGIAKRDVLCSFILNSPNSLCLCVNRVLQRCRVVSVAAQAQCFGRFASNSTQLNSTHLQAAARALFHTDHVVLVLDFLHRVFRHARSQVVLFLLQLDTKCILPLVEE